MFLGFAEEIPKQSIPEIPNLIESEQKEERRKTIEDPYLQAPILMIGYKIPPGNTHEYFAMELLNRALGSGQSSRLYQKLVKEKEVAACPLAREAL